jgi:2-polyprenyl-3-methyl-5-hydroxy-6-metoxy-1,4-benzoquinol methylase
MEMREQPPGDTLVSNKNKWSEVRKGAIPCPYCGEESVHLVSSSDVNKRTTTDVFHYYKCSGCDIVFLHPRPDDMSPFYSDGYLPIPEKLSQLGAMAKKEEYRMEPVLKYKKGGKLLEIGPWVGIFSYNAKKSGFDVTAIEINPRCVDFLNNVVGIKTIQSSEPAKAMGAMHEKFDVIALWHSLEHLPNPWNVLKKAAERLAPGGILLIAVPNIESYDFSVLKAGWMHLDAPRHLFLYTAGSLERVCSANGLKALELTRSDRLSRLLSRMAWHKRAVSMIPVKYVRGIVGLLMYQTAKIRGRDGSGLTAIFTNPK